MTMGSQMSPKVLASHLESLLHNRIDSHMLTGLTIIIMPIYARYQQDTSLTTQGLSQLSVSLHTCNLNAVQPHMLIVDPNIITPQLYHAMP